MRVKSAHALLVMVSTLIVATMTGCGPDGTSASDRVLASGDPLANLPAVDYRVPEKNEALWVLPLDDGMLSDFEPLMDTYASALLGVDCMNDSGYSFPTPHLAVDELPQARAGGRLTVEIAESAGYFASTFDQGEWLRPLNDFFQWVESQGDAVYQEFLTCFDEGSARLAAAGDPGDASNYVTSVVLNEASESYESPPVVDATAAWTTCVSLAGLVGAAESPRQMPTAEMREIFGIKDNDRQEAHTVSAAESEAAIDDAHCREESGYNSALYDSLWETQLAVLNAGDPQLITSLGVLQAWRAEVRMVVAAHPEPAS